MFWIDDKIKSKDDIAVLTGDFNAEPSSETYRHVVKCGFRSSFATANGKEPQKTFPTGLLASYMDTDPALAVDFIFYRVGAASD